MQETRQDLTEVLTPNATVEMFKKALDDPRNVSVAIHKPGAVFNSLRRTFRVAASGALEQQNDKRRSARKRQKRARKAGRR